MQFLKRSLSFSSRACQCLSHIQNNTWVTLGSRFRTQADFLLNLISWKHTRLTRKSNNQSSGCKTRKRTKSKQEAKSKRNQSAFRFFAVFMYGRSTHSVSASTMSKVPVHSKRGSWGMDKKTVRTKFYLERFELKPRPDLCELNLFVPRLLVCVMPAQLWFAR